ncbi:MAG: Peptide chain release factor 2 [Alphaproteobacteria bacterium MarineAlpha5_Bin2]|nr:MAG: Peptide chain release factor 2 [Alphaproteobacteria bacterium MarineAlpha5_Bin2]PPR56974.1 MAG: Peptide chain release factor 2 [Alphaproteobacteria bacterium MarineAlpha5_Bin3]
MEKDLLELKQKTNDPNIWENLEAKTLFQNIKIVEKKIADFHRIKQSLSDLKEFYAFAVDENDQQTIIQLVEDSNQLLKDSTEVRYLNLMNGEADQNNAFVEIHAGAGGTESQDWAEMLQRMYVRWAESKTYRVSLLQESRGEEAGIKSSTIKISGDFTYGWLKRESGIHRLVRISPFDSNKRRHTSFASIWVYPEIDEKIEIDINETDLRIDTYRASGAGGQHVNKTDSAVRITHIPTKVVVQCQNDRSQHKNKSNAMAMLKSRLYELELQKRKEEENKIHSEKKDIGWGHQIRSYVLHPYKLIKDLRTNHESSNVNDILNGDIDKFLEKSLTLK